MAIQNLTKEQAKQAIEHYYMLKDEIQKHKKHCHSFEELAKHIQAGFWDNEYIDVDFGPITTTVWNNGSVESAEIGTHLDVWDEELIVPVCENVAITDLEQFFNS